MELFVGGSLPDGVANTCGRAQQQGRDLENRLVMRDRQLKARVAACHEHSEQL
jgi:hypothetical protein